MIGKNDIGEAGMLHFVKARLSNLSHFYHGGNVTGENVVRILSKLSASKFQEYSICKFVFDSVSNEAYIATLIGVVLCDWTDELKIWMRSESNK